MNWSRGQVLAGLTALSVVLTTLVGVVSNVLVDSWGWALLTSLLVLVTCLAILEVVRHRMASAESAVGAADGGRPPQAAPGGVVISQSRVKGNVAGRDINQTRIGTGGLAGIIAVAVLLGGGATALGRTNAAVPGRVSRDAAGSIPTGRIDGLVVPPAKSAGPTATASDPGVEPSPAVQKSTLQFNNGVDVDPKAGTSGTVDMSFQSNRTGQGGLSLLNGAALAPIPGNGRPTLDSCSGAAGYSTAMMPMPIANGVSRCLRTSDGRIGALNIINAETDALGGHASIVWTVW